jgi:DNA invertase Pin-like site-specific DNA recombinase
VQNHPCRTPTGGRRLSPVRPTVMPMTRYGYARVSSRKQDVRGQVVQLRAAGVDELRTEVGSGAGSRPVLDQLLDELVAGDVLVGTA